MRLALFVTALFLATPILAGCLAVPPKAPATNVSTNLPPLPAGAAPFSQLVCVGNVLAPLAGDHAKDCNYRASAPPAGPGAEVSIAVNPKDPSNLVGGSKDFTLPKPGCYMYNVWSGVYVSHDSGRTWNHSLLPGYPGDARKTALSDYECASDPVVTFDKDGVVYYTSLAYTSDQTKNPPVPQLEPLSSGNLKMGLTVTRSLDGGNTWQDPVLLTSRDASGGLDKQWIATDPENGDIYVSCIDTGTQQFYVQRSSDHGVPWSKPDSEVDTNANDQTSPIPRQFGQIAVGPGHLVYFTYFSSAEETATVAVYEKSSSDFGATWSAARHVADFIPPLDFTGAEHKYRMVGNPALAVDAASGLAAVVFPSRLGADSQTVSGDSDIYVATSTDGGKTWRAPIKVNDDTTPAGAASTPTNEQWMPAIAIGPDGTIHATWLDYRDDPQGQFAYVYYAFSKDGGKTWSKNARVSDVAFDGTGGYHQSGCPCFIGDYMGLAVDAHAVYPFWADTRFGRNDVFAAIMPA
ncbi:MAG: hypothetical protein ACYDCK_11845 [Thermoplasmatota archaeon]